MYLHKELSRHFLPTVQDRGYSYIHQKRVKIIKSDSRSIDFEVCGKSGSYWCYITWSKEKKKQYVNLFCDCPYYIDHEHNCKHLWASILYGDKKRIWKNLNPSLPVLLKGNHTPNNNKPLPTTTTLPQSHWTSWFKEVSEGSSHPKKQQQNVLQAYYMILMMAVEDDKYHSRLPIRLYQKNISDKNSVITAGISNLEIPLFKDHKDRNILKALLSSTDSYSSLDEDQKPVFDLFMPKDLQNLLISEMVDTGRLYLESHKAQKSSPYKLTHQQPLNPLSIKVIQVPNGYKVTGELEHPIGDNKYNITDIPIILKEGTYITKTHVGHIDIKNYKWVELLKNLKDEVIHKDDSGLLITSLSHIVDLPIQWPKSLQWDQVCLPPQPKLLITNDSYQREYLTCQLKFMYGSVESSLSEESRSIADSENQKIYLRDLDLEKKYFTDLTNDTQALSTFYEEIDYCDCLVSESDFVPTVEFLLKNDWLVEAYGKKVKRSTNFNVSVKSGIDWFDLKADVTFASNGSGGTSLSLQALLEHLKKGHRLIPLGNNEFGMMPEEWIKKYASLAHMGDVSEEGIRLKRSQGLFLDGYLSKEKNVTFDVDFKEFQRGLRSFKLKKEQPPSEMFKGDLRPYQKVGLSWLEYLKHFQLGGILADDMGLGKTIQVLSFLQKESAKIKQKGSHSPSLIIVPKSLVFNWKSEVEKFTPDLKVITYVGNQRSRILKDIPHNDIIITTYHILRRDLSELSENSFHYVIVDEAQAIKNEKSQISQACKLVPSQNRLALTGTPVENSISDLFSIMDFTNPGLISGRVKEQFCRPSTTNKDLSMLNKSISPLILRRKKEEVLTDFPSKSINILQCELSQRERKLYDDLKFHYQMNLSKKFSQKGFKKSKIDVLEALLRLRQVSCHPQLINKDYKRKSSKVETLLDKLHEVISGGHKCLIFSQFTSFLKIVEQHLIAEKIKYCYLDGATRNRQQLVDTFQRDARIKTFLISLKAGGVGLNLTAADYVFILDPWWNPAVELQAIDRTHRIGQKNKVVAYKLIAKDTVEEKILKLQESKQQLSQAIVSSDAGMLKKLTVEDLNFLLE